MRYYSQTTGCTYIVGLHSSMPDDAVVITEARYLAVIAQPAPDKVRSHDAEGLPVLVDRPQPNQAEVLAESHRAQVDAVNRACEAAILGGFSSSALGDAHRYSSQLEDQLNLTGAIQRGVEMPFACIDADGIKAYRTHTPEQLLQVGNDFTDYKQVQLQRASDLKLALNRALANGDFEAIATIAWTASA